VANFDRYDGQSFTVSPDSRSLDTERVVVQSRLVPRRGDSTELDYVMKQSPSGWKIIDVLSTGSISRVAEQRSDFRHIMSRGGGDALLANLRRKVSELSGGAEVQPPLAPRSSASPFTIELPRALCITRSALSCWGS
jgi:phospholipid transport system substrate-binding protein